MADKEVRVTDLEPGVRFLYREGSSGVVDEATLVVLSPTQKYVKLRRNTEFWEPVRDVHVLEILEEPKNRFITVMSKEDMLKEKDALHIDVIDGQLYVWGEMKQTVCFYPDTITVMNPHKKDTSFCDRHDTKWGI